MIRRIKEVKIFEYDSKEEFEEHKIALFMFGFKVDLYHEVEGKWIAKYSHKGE